MTLVHAFCCSKDPETRVRAAEVLSKMSSDKLMGPKAGIALSKFLPEIFLDAVKKSAETAVQVRVHYSFFFTLYVPIHFRQL